MVAYFSDMLYLPYWRPESQLPHLCVLPDSRQCILSQHLNSDSYFLLYLECAL